MSVRLMLIIAQVIDSVSCECTLAFHPQTQMFTRTKSVFCVSETGVK